MEKCSYIAVGETKTEHGGVLKFTYYCDKNLK